jgi:hypothetical protein
LTGIAVAIIRSLGIAGVVVATSIVVLSRVTIAGIGITIAGVGALSSITIPRTVILSSIAVASIIIRASVSIVVSTPVIITALSYVSVRVVSDLLAKLRMILQVGLQLGVLLHIPIIINELRVAPKLLGNFAVAIKELIEVRPLVALALVLVTIVTGFLMHESVRIFLQLLANVRMLLHERLQRGMIFHEFVVVDERRILPNLFGNLAVAVEELVKPREFLACNVGVLR